MLLNTIRILLIFWMITIVCAPPKSPSTKDNKPTSNKTKKISTNDTKSSTSEKKPSKSTKEKKPKRIGFLTALAVASKIGPELALKFGPKAYKAMKKRYESGKAHLKVMGEDGKMRDAKDGEAVRVDLSQPETYAIIDKKGKEAIVAHPILLAYNPPDPKDIHGKGPAVMVEHMASPWNQGVQQWDQNGYGYTATTYDYQQTQQPYTTHDYVQRKMGSTYTDTYTDNTYSPQGTYTEPYTQEGTYSQHEDYTDPYTQEGTYSTYEEQETYTDLPEHTQHYPDHGPPKSAIPPSRAIPEIILWPGFWEKLSDGKLMEAYHIPYAFAQDSTFSYEDVEKIRVAMKKFAEMTCVRFTPTWYAGQHHIVLNNQKDGGCCSYAGVVTNFGDQPFNLETPMCMEESIIIHELMHAAGLHHTQQRADRDNYVNVHWDYISEDYKDAYQLYTNYLPLVPYDKRSGMHYMSNQNEKYSSMTDHTNQPIMHEHKIRLGDWHWTFQIGLKLFNQFAKYRLSLIARHEQDRQPNRTHIRLACYARSEEKEENGWAYAFGSTSIPRTSASMLLNTIRIMLIFCLIAIVCAPPKSHSTSEKKKIRKEEDKKPSTKEKTSTTEKKPPTREKKTSTTAKKSSANEIPKPKPKRIGFLTACAIAANISPDLALNFGPKAYKAMKKRYESGKAHLKVKGKDGKLRNATKGEAIRINLSKPETYAVIETNKTNPKQQEAIVAHPMLLNYNPPDPKDIRDTPVVAAHMPHNGYQWDQNGNTATTYDYNQQTQQQYTDNSSYYQQYTGDTNTQQNTYNVQSSYNVIYSPHDIYGRPSTQDVDYSQSGIYTGPSTQDATYTTYEQPSTYTYEDLGTYTDLPEHTPHNPDQGPPKNEIPPSRAITDVTLWPGFWEQLPDGSWMEAYHIPYAFAEDSTFSDKDKKLIRESMDKFAKKTCVRFTPTWYDGQHHVVINNKEGGGCCSYAGVETYFGNQPLNLEDGCMEEAIIIHELMHATGEHHTQNRADRDQNIKVFWDNIVEKHKTDYQLFTNYLPLVPYDKRSVMHYQSVHGNLDPKYAAVADLNDQPIIHEEKVRQSDWHAINVNYQCHYYLGLEEKIGKKKSRS